MLSIWNTYNNTRDKNNGRGSRYCYSRQSVLSDIGSAKPGRKLARPYCTDQSDKGKLASCGRCTSPAFRAAKPEESLGLRSGYGGRFANPAAVSRSRGAGALRLTRGPDDGAVGRRPCSGPRRAEGRVARTTRPIRRARRCARTGRLGDRPVRCARHRSSADIGLAVARPARGGPPSRRLRRAARSTPGISPR